MLNSLRSALLGLLLVPAAAFAQMPPYSQSVNLALTDVWQGDGRNGLRWKSAWITAPDSCPGYEVLLFRKVVELDKAPGEFIVNVSADNRYKLYVNGSLVSDGPAKGDIYNWSFETVDIAPFLRAGKNAVSAVVWNFAENRPVAVMSLGKTGFMIQGNSPDEEILNTGGNWKVFRCGAYSPVDVKVRGYYAAGCCDRLDGTAYPWGWQEVEFDDGTWSKPVSIGAAAPKGAGNYHLWQLVPRRIPPMEYRNLEFGAEIAGTVIPAGTTREFLLANDVLTTGYPEIRVSGGRGASVVMSYAEALYEGDKDKYAKGDRRVTDGKKFVGYEDIFIADGGASRTFVPLWWRTWRYMRITVTTHDEPLSIDSLTACSSMYPFTLESTFSACGAPELGEMLEIGWRTARLCAHETYMDCPYYEQLQYFGDSRIQALVTMFNTRDTCLVRNLLEQGRMSMGADGFTMSRYPSHIYQYITPYSLAWICTAHDWWMYRGDESFLRTLLPAMRQVLTSFDSYVDKSGCLSHVPHWNFADWAALDSGVFPCDAQGHSAYMDLMLLLALRDATEMEGAFGSSVLAGEYRTRAQRLSEAVRKQYWSSGRGMFADNGAMQDFSQHAQALAILADVVTGDEASELMRRTMEDKTLRPCTIYFRYFLQAAMKRSGNGEMFLDNLDILRDQMALGLTTWAEMPEPSRSDCHAWGSSPNIELFRTVLGIDSASPGFASVLVSPELGRLKDASGSIPHPSGEIAVSYHLSDKGRLDAVITLPEDVIGHFVWKGNEKPLRGGVNKITVKAK